MKVIGNLTKDAIIRAAVSEGFTVTQVLGSETTFESGGRCDGVDIVYDSNAQKVVIAYRDNSNSAYGTAIVGTVSDTSISFGSATVFNTGTTDYIRIDYDANAQKVVIVYKDQNSKGKAIVGTVSGTSISFGSSAEFGTNIAHISIAYDTNAQKNVISYQNGADSDHGYAIVGTVSGTSISFGSAAEYENSAVLYTEITYDSTAQKVILAWRDSGDSNKGKAAVGTVSGTSISYGSIVTFASGGTDEVRLAYDPNQNKTGFFYKDIGNSYYGTSTVATVSGTSISFGTAQVFNSAEVREFAAIYDTLAQRIVLTYRDVGNGERGTILTASISGTSMTFGTEAVFSQDPRRIHSTYDSNQQRVVCAYDDEGQNIGRSIVIKTGYTSATGGTIADGSAVIVNANGTVSSVGQSTLTEAVGTPVLYENSGTGEHDVVFDSSNNKVVVTYRDTGTSNYGTAVVGTVNASDNSITFGTPVVFTTKNIEYSSCTFDSTNNKVVIAYANSASPRYGHAIVGTVSGTSISFGSEATFNAYEVQHVAIGFDAGAGKVVIAYEDWGNSNYGTAIVGTVSGTSITFGTEVTYESARTQHPSIVYDSNAGKTVICFSTYGDSEHGYGIVGTVSGTSISFGSKAEFENAVVANVETAYDSSAQKIVVVYRDNGNSYYGTAAVGTVSGTSISFGTPAVFAAVNVGANGNAATYDSTANKVVITNLGDDKVVTGTISGTSISFDTPFIFDSGAAVGCGVVFDTNAKKNVIAYADSGNNNYGTAVVYQPAASVSNLTSENFVGFMDGAALDGTNGEILSSCSIARNQTSLTPGQTYFVSPTDGALSLTAGSPSVTAGTAISSTELIVKG